MDLGLKGKTALVTGASAGLGFASAMALAEEGAKVFIASRDRKRIDSAALAIEQKTGGTVIPCTADLNVDEDIAELILKVEEVDILVSNTGGPPAGELDHFDTPVWKEQYEAIFESALKLSTAFSLGMRHRGWGRIIYITSITSLRPRPRMALSNALRAGISGLASTQALEWGHGGVTVNCVAPGLIETNRLRDLYEKEASEKGLSLSEILSEKSATIPVGRIGQPADLGSTVAFLSSEQAGYLNGLVLPVDGGMHI